MIVKKIIKTNVIFNARKRILIFMFLFPGRPSQKQLEIGFSIGVLLGPLIVHTLVTQLVTTTFTSEVEVYLHHVV